MDGVNSNTEILIYKIPYPSYKNLSQVQTEATP